MQKILTSSGQSFSMGLIAGATILDRLAWLLTQAAHVALGLSEKVQRLMHKILLFTGRTAYRGARFTLEFVRWVLGVLWHTVVTLTRLALDVVT